LPQPAVTRIIAITKNLFINGTPFAIGLREAGCKQPFLRIRPSAASAFGFRVEGLQLRSRVVDAKLPIDTPLLLVGVLVPSRRFLA